MTLEFCPVALHVNIEQIINQQGETQAVEALQAPHLYELAVVSEVNDGYLRQ